MPLRCGGRRRSGPLWPAPCDGGAFASGAYPGPRTQVSCTPLSQTGGHGDGWTQSGAVLDTDVSDLPPGTAKQPVREEKLAGEEGFEPSIP